MFSLDKQIKLVMDSNIGGFVLDFKRLMEKKREIETPERLKIPEITEFVRLFLCLSLFLEFKSQRYNSVNKMSILLRIFLAKIKY